MKVLIESAFTAKNIKKLVGFFLFISVFIYLQRRYSNIGPEDVKLFIQQFGMLAPILFLGVSFIRPVIFFPITVFYLAAGLAFGFVWGAVLAISSALISAWVAYIISKKVGIDFFPMKWRSRICAIQTRIDEQGLRNMIFVRFIPLVSFDLISYASGMAGFKLSNYLLGTFIGISPRVIAYSYVGANIIDPNDPRFIFAMGVLFLIFIIPFIVLKISERNKAKKISMH